MVGFELQILESEATALPTAPQALPLNEGVQYFIECALFQRNYMMIYWPAHNTWKVGEKRFKILIG